MNQVEIQVGFNTGGKTVVADGLWGIAVQSVPGNPRLPSIFMARDSTVYQWRK